MRMEDDSASAKYASETAGHIHEEFPTLPFPKQAKRGRKVSADTYFHA
jgi:hypothetical protein